MKVGACARRLASDIFLPTNFTHLEELEKERREKKASRKKGRGEEKVGTGEICDLRLQKGGEE